MKILITGASGFLGQELAASLLRTPPPSVSIDSLILTDLRAPPKPDIQSPALSCVAADLTQPSEVERIFSQPLDAVFLMHGIMSGAAEANLELGLAVNLNASINILNQLRASNPGVTLVYASVLAAFGPATDPSEVISETTAPNPQSSYGSQKVMVEGLINDFSRRGLIDGRILRLPTIMPRAGAPTGAASSFCSDIIREPLNGRSAVLPMANKTLKMYVCSTRTIIENFKIAMMIPTEKYDRYLNRVAIMPGTVATVQDELDALVQVSPDGTKVLKLIEEKPDDQVERIVASWPHNYDVSRALDLGFRKDGGLLLALQEYFDEHIAKKSVS